MNATPAAEPGRRINCLSAILPVHDERDSLRELHARLSDVLRGLQTDGDIDDWEIIFVDDGSRDSSWEVILDLVRSDTRTVGARLSRNFGQTPAVFAGLEVSRGDSIAMMDSDLELSPEDLGQLLAAHRPGRDLVTGVRPRHRRPGRQLPSMAFNRLISRTLGIEFEDIGCGYVVMDRELMEELGHEGDVRRNAMVVAAAARLADRHVQVPVQLHRTPSRSSYPTFRLATNAVEALNAFGDPLRATITMGAALTVLAAIATVVGATATILDASAWTWAALAAGIIALVLGVQICILGIVGNQALRTLRYHGTPFVRVRDVVRGTDEVSGE